jgi:tetratricopeptide (TPR) repeat protein
MIQAKNDLKDDPNAYRMLADFYLSQGDWDKALPEFEAISQQHPKDMALKKSLAQVLIYKNQLDQATKLDAEILNSNSSDVDGLILKGQILNVSNRAHDAIQVLQTAVRNAPESALAHYHLGVAFSKTGDWTQAIAQWNEATRRQATMVDAYRALGDAAMHTGDAGLLRESASQVIRLQPSSADGYVMRAIALLSRKEYAPAETDLQKAIQLAPQAPAPYTQLGNLRFVQKRYAQAEKFYEQALDRNPSTPGALQGLVRIDFAQKQPARAIERVRAQIARVPDDSDYYFLLGRLLFDSHDPANAETAFEKAIQINKDNADAAILLGEIQSGHGAMDQALATYQTAVNQNPRDIRFYAAMASLEETRGNWQHAEQLYQKLLDIQSEQPLAANNLAYLLLQHNGDKNLALALAQTARKGLPDSPSTADTLAWAYYQIGSYNSAIDLLRPLVEKVPDNATYQYHLGMAYAKTDNLPQAKRYLQRALQISPNFSQADEIRSILARSSPN